MSEYSGIRGTRVKYLSSDPTLNTSTEGQVWYNSTSGTLKSLVQIKAWSAGGNMGTARYLVGSCGTQTAALGFGGYSGTYSNATEEYNGFSWTAGGNMGTARFNPGGAGSQTAALAFGGFIAGPPTSPTNATEEYDGSSWTAQNTMPTAVRNPAGSGTQTAGLSSGGNDGSVTGVTQEYDGTNWTTSPGSMNVARENATAFGIQTATIVAGGNEPGVNNAEQYDGSTWTSINNLNSPVYSLASAANGTTSHGITFGGASPAGTGLTQTEEWDGTIWTISSASLAAGKWKLGGAGTASAGLKFAGGPPPSGNVATEEYVSSIDAYSPSTASAWASGVAMGTARASMGSLGTQTANMVVAGYAPVLSNTAQTYDGSSWTSIPNLSGSPRRSNAGFGSTTAAASLGGSIGSLPPTANTVNTVEEYDGSSWTAATGYPVGVYDIEACGTQTAGLGAGGYITPSDPGTTVNTTFDYNGSSWTANNNMNNARNNFSMTGIQTASLVAGGTGNPTKAEIYDGTNWTAISDITSTKMSAASGTTTAGLVYGGNGPGSAVATTFIYDGSSWATSASMATARDFLGGSSASPGSSALATGGYVGAALQTITEEFNTGSPITPTGAQASTLTTS